MHAIGGGGTTKRGNITSSYTRHLQGDPETPKMWGKYLRRVRTAHCFYSGLPGMVWLLPPHTMPPK